MLGEELHYYRVKIPQGTFESLRNYDYPNNVKLWDDWVQMIQVTLHDLLLLLPYEKFVVDVEIEDWLGFRNCVGVVRKDDHALCDFDNENYHSCRKLYELMIPPSILGIPAINVNAAM